MSAIHRFSLAYDAEEDRLTCDTEDQSGATTRLWLTQRLCRGLLGAILPMLQKAVRQEVAPEHQATVQSFEQAAALSGFGKLPPVQARAETVTGLVKAVHIQPGARGLSMTFDFGADGHRTLALTFAEVRQMLAVMHRLQAMATWPLDLWPDWIAGGGEGAAGTAAALN
jgi:hypothetical protein